MKQSAFELFLDGLDPEWREHQLGFFRIMAAAGPDAVEELAGRVYQVSCPAGLKRLALEFSYYFPWPEWSAVIDRILKHEKNLAFFETGARALGKIRTPAALESLRNLSLSRATPGFREIVDQVLRETDPAEAFQHHFSRLLKGSAQPGDANEGAHQLARVIGPGNLEPLKAGVNHPDPLVFRHALRLICLIQSREAAAVLFDYLNEAQLDATEDREARGILAEFRALPRPEVREKALRSLSGRWEEKKPEAVVDLVSGQADRVQAAATMLRRVSADTLDALLADTLLAALDEKPAQLAEFLTQAGETAQNRARRVDFALQTAAEGLADMAGRGLIAPGLLLPALAEPLRQGTGNAGVATALARLVPPSNQDLLDLLLDQTEGSLRSAALEVLGGRQDPAFRESLLKLRRDPIADIADRSLWHLGQLPEAAGTARALLAHSDPDEVLVGLRFIAMHKLQDLVPELLDLAARESRESPLLATYKTLGQVGSPHAVGPLLGLLQTSLAPGIRVAIAEALRDLGDATGALGLCAKAGELKSPELCTVAVEAFARAHDSADRPLPASNSALLVAMTQCGWSSRHPWPLRLRIADALVAIHGPDRALWVEVANHLQSTLSEKRSPGAVSTEDVAHLQACARILAQKAQADPGYLGTRVPPLERE